MSNDEIETSELVRMPMTEPKPMTEPEPEPELELVTWRRCVWITPKKLDNLAVWIK